MEYSPEVPESSKKESVVPSIISASLGLLMMATYPIGGVAGSWYLIFFGAILIGAAFLYK